MTTEIGKKKPVIVALALAASMSFATGAAAEDFNIDKGEFAGSFITSNFSYDNLDRTISTTVTGDSGKKSQGEFQSHTASDLNFLFTSCTDPNLEGQAFNVERSQAVLTFKKGQLFLEAQVPAPAPEGCAYVINPEEGRFGFKLEVVYTIVGGTGIYAGAIGELTSISEGVLMTNENSSSGYNQFGGVTGTLSGSFCTDCP